MVSSPSRPHPFKTTIDHCLTKIGRNLAGGHIPSIAKSIFAHAGLREALLLKVMDQIGSECGGVCRRNTETPSLFQSLEVGKLDGFCWSDCISELQTKCPMLLRLLTSVVSSNDHRNAQKHSSSHHPGLCTAIAIILKERNREMCGVQTFLSLVLFNSHVQKKVCVCVCVSKIQVCTHNQHF